MEPTLDVFAFFTHGRAMGWVTAGLFLQLQPGVNVFAEEAHAGFLEVIDLIHVGQLMAFVHGLLQLWGAARPGQRPFHVPMMAVIHRFFMHGGVYDLVRAGGAWWEGLFTATPVGQHEMEQVSRRDDGTADQPKILLGHHVFDLRLRNNLQMADGIPAVLIHKGVKTLEVIVINLFPLLDSIVQLVGIHSTAKEGVLRVQGLRDAMML